MPASSVTSSRRSPGTRRLIVPSRLRARQGARGTGAGFTLAASVLGFFVITLDAVVVNVALPSIQRDFGGAITGLQWIVDGYILMFAALLLSAGALSDRVGARRAFAAGVVVFVIASAACGLAPSLGALLLLAQTQRSPRRKVPFDWVGQATAVVAMGSLTFGAIEAGADGFAAPRVVSAFAVAVVALVAFLAAEARVAHPGPVPVPHRVGSQRCGLRVHRRLLRATVRDEPVPPAVARRDVANQATFLHGLRSSLLLKPPCTSHDLAADAAVATAAAADNAAQQEAGVR